MEAIDTVCVDLEMYEGCQFHGEKIRLGKRVGRKPLGSPAGKDSWLGILLRHIPKHKVYVEPYAGSASLFFAKEPSDREILADKNMGFISVYRFLRDGNDADFLWMREQAWKGSQNRFATLLASKPQTLRERAYRFKYLNLYSLRRACDKFGILPGDRRTGKEFLASLEKWRERLSGVEILHKDAMQVALQYDSKDTFHYIDPPWKKITGMLGGGSFDEQAFIGAVSKLKGKALISYQGALELGASWKLKEHTPNSASFSESSKQRMYMNYSPQMFRVGKLDTNFSELSKDEIVKAAKTRKQFLRRNKVTSRPLQRAIHRFFKKIVRREVSKLQRNGTIRLFSNKAGKKQRVRKNVSGLVLIEKTIADEDEFRALLRTYGIRTYEKAGKRTSNALGGVWKVRPVELDLLIRDKDILLAETMQEILAELQDTVRDVLIESSQMQPRPGIGDITREIYSRTLHTGAVSPARAERIARTEIASYENSGIVQGYVVSGIKRIKWLSIIDGRTRDETRNPKWKRAPANHVVMNGVEVEMGKPFVNKSTGASLRYPGDPRGAPQEIINCRCTTMPVVNLKR